jgi:hypothetical protein
MTATGSSFPLEDMARDVQAGIHPMSDLVKLFRGEMVFFPSSTDPMQGPPSPIMTKIDDNPYIVVGTSPQALQSLGSMVKYVLTLTGLQVISGVASGVGIVVKLPQGSFVMDAGLVAEAKDQFPQS